MAPGGHLEGGVWRASGGALSSGGRLSVPLPVNETDAAAPGQEMDGGMEGDGGRWRRDLMGDRGRSNDPRQRHRRRDHGRMLEHMRTCTKGMARCTHTHVIVQLRKQCICLRFPCLHGWHRHCAHLWPHPAHATAHANAHANRLPPPPRRIASHRLPHPPRRTATWSGGRHVG